MKKEKIIIISLAIIFVIVTSILIGIIVSNNKSSKNEQKKLQSSIDNYKIRNEELNEKVSDLKNELKFFNDYICEYTQTFRYIDEYDYQGTVPESKFIVVDRFQEHFPIILVINKEKFDINFEKNKNYEITFNGSINGNKTAITKIEETEKVGLEQIQESCVVSSK